MKLIVQVALLALLLFSTRSANGDTVELRSGGRLTGEVLEETTKEVVIRTPAGVVRLGRSEVVRIRRKASPAADPAPAPGQKTASAPAGGRLRIEGVRPDVAPVAIRGEIVVALADGGVGWVRADTGERRGEAGIESRLGPVTGLAADAGAVYLVTAEGSVVRLIRRSGLPLWSNPLGSPIHGSPLIHRRWVFVFVPGRGLLALESSTGKVRTELSLELEADTPLVSAGTGLALGACDGRLLLISGDGSEVLRTIETGSRWHGSPPAVTLNRVALAGRGKLTLLPLVERTSPREAPVGLHRHPLAADPSRVYCELLGTLSSLTPLTGRATWKATEIGRVTHLTVNGPTILAVSSDGRMSAISTGTGRKLWSVTLGAPGTCPPLFEGGKVAVITERGDLEIFDPDNLPAEGDRGLPKEPEKASRASSDSRVRSPDGYSFATPDGWDVAARSAAEDVSHRLRPAPEVSRSRFGRQPEDVLDRFVRRGHIEIRVAPANGESPSNLALSYLIDEKTDAQKEECRLGPPSIRTTGTGGLEWTEVVVQVDQPVPGGVLAFHKRVLIRLLDEDRAVWIELLTPVELREEGDADLKRVLDSFEPEN